MRRRKQVAGALEQAANELGAQDAQHPRLADDPRAFALELHAAEADARAVRREAGPSRELREDGGDARGESADRARAGRGSAT